MSKIKLIVEIEKRTYELLKEKSDNIAESIIANGTPYNPSGDAISRSDLKDKMKKAEEQADTFEMLVEFYEQIIDNAQAVPLPNEQIAWEQGYETGLAQAVEITEEQAINKLHETGWLIGHDKEMTTRPQGEWIFKNGKYRCTACGGKAIYRYSGSLAITQTELLTQFCPNCGAKMVSSENN